MSDYVPVTGESARIRHHGTPDEYSGNLRTVCGQGAALTQVELDRAFSLRGKQAPKIVDIPMCKRCTRIAAGTVSGKEDSTDE